MMICRKSYLGAKKQVSYITLEEARKNGLNLTWDQSQIVVPQFYGHKNIS